MKIKTLLFIASLSTILSCKGVDSVAPSGTSNNNNTGTVSAPKPTAEFTASYGTSGRVSFNNVSTNANSYKWDFGDGYSSYETSPIHLYERNGSYSVVMTASGSGGSDVKVKSVYVTNIVGSVVVYKNFSTGNTNIDVYVDGNFWGVINGSYYYSSAPSCGNGNSVTASSLSEGTHTITAKEKTILLPKSWSGSIAVIGGACSSFGLR